mmetsp:Transcript_5302/g.9546  ORF Transcript_5302/g.9546 Transcript_5302/m.9546 type:complete len:297 (+) Transcript_5302:103-993(+)
MSARSVRRTRCLQQHLVAGNRDEVHDESDVVTSQLVGELCLAWNSGTPVQILGPDDVPRFAVKSLQQVYDVHRRLMRIGPCGASVGYKLGGIGAATLSDGQPCAAIHAPLWRNWIVQGDGVARLSIQRLGVFAVELEIAFIMGKTLQASGAPYTEHEVTEAVEHVCLALEVVGSRFGAQVDKVPSLLRLADCLCAGGVVLGHPLDVKPGALVKPRTAHLTVNGSAESEGSTADAPLGNPLAALTWLVNDLASKKRCLYAGELVISGKCAITKAFKAGDKIQGTVQGLGTIEGVLTN